MTRTAVALVSLTFLLAGCGSSEKDGGSQTAQPTGTASQAGAGSTAEFCDFYASTEPQDGDTVEDLKAQWIGLAATIPADFPPEGRELLVSLKDSLVRAYDDFIDGGGSPEYDASSAKYDPDSGAPESIKQWKDDLEAVADSAEGETTFDAIDAWVEGNCGKTAPANSDNPTGACDLLTSETAALALGGNVELDMAGAGPAMQGIESCQYNLVGGAMSTHVSLSVVSPTSELFDDYTAPPTTCGMTSAVPTRAEDIAPGAYRCLLISSYDGSVSQDTVQWPEGGKMYYLFVNADGDDSLPENAGVDAARAIRDYL